MGELERSEERIGGGKQHIRKNMSAEDWEGEIKRAAERDREREGGI